MRLVGLDDLIAAPDKYGMALSYVLHRGFADLGEEMTDSWQIFLNADFVLADGSLRALLPHLARGRRIVASPSYCVNEAAVIPELRQRIDPGTLGPDAAPAGDGGDGAQSTGTTPFAARPSTSVRSACS